jgi:hypothetical protein
MRARFVSIDFMDLKGILGTGMMAARLAIMM